MKIIDIYSGQGDIDFNKVKAFGIEGVIIKATEGLTYNDPTLINYYNNAKMQGLKVGFYHYMRMNDAEKEAEHFIKITSGLSPDFKYAVDVECENLISTPSDTVSRVQKFVNYMKANNKDIMLYSYTWFYKNILSSINNIPLWIAEYGTSKPNITISYIGWQYSCKGKVDGILTDVDLDEFSDGIYINNNIIQKPILIDENVKTLQILCNSLNVRDERNAVLDVDGITGPHTKFAVSHLPYCGLPYRQVLATKYIQKRVSVIDDGIFGNITRMAVIRWQRQNQLLIDGIVGPQTWLSFLYN